MEIASRFSCRRARTAEKNRTDLFLTGICLLEAQNTLMLWQVLPSIVEQYVTVGQTAVETSFKATETTVILLLVPFFVHCSCNRTPHRWLCALSWAARSSTAFPLPFVLLVTKLIGSYDLFDLVITWRRAMRWRRLKRGERTFPWTCHGVCGQPRLRRTACLLEYECGKVVHRRRQISVLSRILMHYFCRDAYFAIKN